MENYCKRRMIMLKEYLDAKDLQSALHLTQSFPELLFTHYFIRNSLFHYPCSEVRVFSYPFENPIYWFLVEVQKNACPFLHIAQSGGKHDSLIFTAGLRLLFEETKMLESCQKIDIGTKALLMHDVTPILSQYFPNHESTSRVPHTVFYMSEEQMDNVLKVDVSLPYGYVFSELELSEAADVKDTIDNDDSVGLVSDRLRHLPSVCIRQSSSPLIISHELCSSRGDMLHLYTTPDHRRQGLGLAAELKLAQTIIRESGTPFKAVPNHLTAILLSSEASSFWTMWTKNQFPVQYIVQRLEKKH